MGRYYLSAHSNIEWLFVAFPAFFALVIHFTSPFSLLPACYSQQHTVICTYKYLLTRQIKYLEDLHICCAFCKTTQRYLENFELIHSCKTVIHNWCGNVSCIHKKPKKTGHVAVSLTILSRGRSCPFETLQHFLIFKIMPFGLVPCIPFIPVTDSFLKNKCVPFFLDTSGVKSP